MGADSAPYRILSLDGGGVRGLLTIALIDQLDRRDDGWRQRIDLFAGTSSGGILALGLAFGLSPARLREFTYETSPVIFGPPPLGAFRFGRVLRSGYDNRRLRAELTAVFGDATLGDLGARVLIPSFDLDSGNDSTGGPRSWKPKFFHNFPGSDSDADRHVVDVALRTSAAPTYFPSAGGFVDGGVAANNPSMAAVAQSQDQQRSRVDRNPGLADLRLLSIGSGEPQKFLPGTRLDWGLASWARHLLPLILDGSVDIPHFQCTRLLGARYHRLQYYFEPGTGIRLDDWRRRDELLDIAARRMLLELDAAQDWLAHSWR